MRIIFTLQTLSPLVESGVPPYPLFCTTLDGLIDSRQINIAVDFILIKAALKA
jgi:hypothetical protein